MRGMTLIVKKVTQIIAGLIFLYGIYIVFHGHLTPGGGFAGGSIMSGAFILLVIAYGSDFLKLKSSEQRSSIIEATGILLFILLVFTGLFIGAEKIFFKNFLPKGRAGELLSAGFIPVLNIFIGMEVAGALLAIFLAFVIKSEEEKLK